MVLFVCDFGFAFAFDFFVVAVGSEVVLVEEIPFPVEIVTEGPLLLFGQGITDVEIHFLQIKHNAIGIYLEKDVIQHLEHWKGKNAAELQEDEHFFAALVSAPVEKLFRIVVIKEIKGSQYAVQLQGAVRDRLASVDKYEAEEEKALEEITSFLQSKYFKKDSVVSFRFPATSNTAEITFATEGKGEAKLEVENSNVVQMMQKWYLGGATAVSPSTVKNLSEKFEALLSV